MRTLLSGARDDSREYSCRTSCAGDCRHTVRWDGRDGTGHIVANGVYFGRLRWGEESSTARLVVLR
jgi:hypothetical protein